jgi:FkbM family methyltransferase
MTIDTDTASCAMLNGCKINVFKNDLITDSIIKEGVFEPELYHFLVHYLALLPSSACLDIGANIGNHTLTLGLHSDTVLAFEPVPFIFNLLKKSVCDNKLDNVKLYNIALSDHAGTAPIHIHTKGNFAASSLTRSSEAMSLTIDVPLKTGDQVVADALIKTIDLIKLDVESHETEVILGLKNTIQTSKPLCILEWNNEKTRQGFKNNNLWESVFSHYSPYCLRNNHRDFKYKSRHNIWLKPFRSFLRPLYKLLFKKKLILGSFHKNQDYDVVLLVPKEKELMAKKAVEHAATAYLNSQALK